MTRGISKKLHFPFCPKPITCLSVHRFALSRVGRSLHPFRLLEFTSQKNCSNYHTCRLAWPWENEFFGMLGRARTKRDKELSSMDIKILSNVHSQPLYQMITGMEGPIEIDGNYGCKCYCSFPLKTLVCPLFKMLRRWVLMRFARLRAWNTLRSWLSRYMLASSATLTLFIPDYLYQFFSNYFCLMLLLSESSFEVHPGFGPNPGTRPQCWGQAIKSWTVHGQSYQYIKFCAGIFGPD